MSYEQSNNLTRFGVALEFRLLKHRDSVTHNLEAAAGRSDELQLGVRKFALELGRQTGGPGLVVSNATVLDGDFHSRLVLMVDRIGPSGRRADKNYWDAGEPGKRVSAVAAS